MSNDVVGFDGTLFTNPEDMASYLAASTVMLSTNRLGNGAGAVVSDDGVVATCAHVAVEPFVDIQLSTGESLPGEVTLRDPDRDLALVRLSENRLPHLSLGDSAALRPGQFVMSMGHPSGGTSGLAMGVIHAVTARSNRWPMVVSDIRLTPGYSGGPMVDSNGAVIGVNAMVSGGLGLAVPSNDVKRMLAVERMPRLGIGARSVTSNSRGGQPTRGMLVTAVVPKSPACKGRLEIGDIVLALDGRPTERTLDLWDGLSKASSSVRFDVLRAGESINLAIHLPEAPVKGTREAA